MDFIVFLKDKKREIKKTQNL
jgi:hypothetical protein